MSNYYNKTDDGVWEVVPNVSQDITLETDGKYVDADIIVKPMSAGKQADFSDNITESDAMTAVPLVEGAGYTPIKNISALTVPEDKKLTSLTLNGIITTLSGTGTITTLSGIQTVSELSGILKVTSNLETTSKLQVNAYNNASTPALTGEKNVIVDGKWNYGTIATGTTNNSDWEQNTTAIVPAEGYLYLNEGWYSNTQISLATLIPDDGEYDNAGVDQIRQNYEAYDTNGKKLIGTIADWIPSSDYYTTTNTGYGCITQGTYVNTSEAYYIKAAAGSVTMTAGDGNVTSSNATLSDTDTSGISVTGSGSVSATAKIDTAGYSSATDSFASGSSTSSNTATQYLTGVTLEAPSSGQRTFTITVPNGSADDTVTFTFKVDSDYNVWVE